MQAFQAVTQQPEIQLRADNFMDWVAKNRTSDPSACFRVDGPPAGALRARGPGVVLVPGVGPPWKLANEHFSLPRPLRARNAEEAQWVAFYQDQTNGIVASTGLFLVSRTGEVIAQVYTCFVVKNKEENRSGRLSATLRPYFEPGAWP